MIKDTVDHARNWQKCHGVDIVRQQNHGYSMLSNACVFLDWISSAFYLGLSNIVDGCEGLSIITHKKSELSGTFMFFYIFLCKYVPFSRLQSGRLWTIYEGDRRVGELIWQDKYMPILCLFLYSCCSFNCLNVTYYLPTTN